MSTGVELVDVAIKLALGEKVEPPVPWGTTVYWPRPGNPFPGSATTPQKCVAKRINTKTGAHFVATGATVAEAIAKAEAGIK